MKNNSQLKIEILTILFKASSHTLQAYTLNKRIGISNDVFLRLIFKLENENYIKIDGSLIELSEKGLEYILFTLNSEKEIKSKIPLKFLIEDKTNIDEFYVPKRSLL